MSLRNRSNNHTFLTQRDQLNLKHARKLLRPTKKQMLQRETSFQNINLDRSQSRSQYSGSFHDPNTSMGRDQRSYMEEYDNLRQVRNGRSPVIKKNLEPFSINNDVQAYEPVKKSRSREKASPNCSYLVDSPLGEIIGSKAQERDYKDMSYRNVRTKVRREMIESRNTIYGTFDKVDAL